MACTCFFFFFLSSKTFSKFQTSYFGNFYLFFVGLLLDQYFRKNDLHFIFLTNLSPIPRKYKLFHFFKQNFISSLKNYDSVEFKRDLTWFYNSRGVRFPMLRFIRINVVDRFSICVFSIKYTACEAFDKFQFSLTYKRTPLIIGILTHLFSNLCTSLHTNFIYSIPYRFNVKYN